MEFMKCILQSVPGREKKRIKRFLAGYKCELSMRDHEAEHIVDVPQGKLLMNHHHHTCASLDRSHAAKMIFFV